MDAEKRVIPIVEDDQGEGWKDPLWVGEFADKLEGVRSCSCYEAELATMKKLVREMAKVLSPFVTGLCIFCPHLNGQHEKVCPTGKAQTILDDPKVQATTAEKKEE